MHSCGYINEQPLRELAKYLDAANIDLKGFTNDFYAKMSEATLEPVLKSLKILKDLNPTPVETLERARQIALDCGLKYVYIGNVAGNPAENTYCPKCKKIVIRCAGYTILENNLENGKCKFCGEKIEGVWR